MDVPLFANEVGRLEALRRYGILDTEAEEAFDDVARLAAHVCAAPIAAIDFVDADRVWVKASVGSGTREVPREVSFARYALERPGLTMIRDVRDDERFVGNPSLIAERGIRFYTGVPVTTADGHAIGVLSVMDHRPRTLSAEQAAGLVALARQTMTQLELRRSRNELRSVAERGHAEDEARRREEQLRLVVEQMPAVLWSTDAELRFTSSTGAGLGALGLRPGQVVGMSLSEYFETDDPEFPAIRAHRGALRGESLTYEQGWRDRVFESHVEPLRDPDGRIVGALGVALDVTEGKRAEGALKEAEARYRTLVEQIPAVTYVDLVDDDLTTAYVSPQVEAMLGFTQDEWCSDPHLWRRQLHPDDRERAVQEYIRGRESGRPFYFEYRMLARDGRVVWIREQALNFPDPAGGPNLVQGVMFDITALKEVEEELERAWQRERRAAEHLRALDEMKNLQLHAVSHDLRGPITAVLGSAILLKSSDLDLPPERRELVDGIVAGGRKLYRLVSDLLDLDRMERGLLEPDRRPIDIGELARRVVDELAIQDHPVEVEADAMEVSVDPVQVERIVENLVANAAKHTPAGTRIWVRVRRDGDGIMLAVEDAGPGVPEELRSVIFEPFRQGGSGPGLGIGLSLVARYAELHGGWAGVGDRDGGGASFRVFLGDGRTRSQELESARRRPGRP